MNTKSNRPHQATFDQGRMSALEMAVATFLRMQQDVPLQLFKEQYADNVRTWDDTTLGMPVSDEYREGMTASAQRLLSLLPGSNPPAA